MKYSKKHFSVFANSINELIRWGNGSEAKAHLMRLGEQKIIREHRAVIAYLSWRCDYPELGIRLLNPLVVPKGRALAKATEREKAEYAACLIRIGAPDEASTLLAKVNPNLVPKAYLYRAFACMVRWEYEESIELLESYLRTPSLWHYDRLVAKINLASGYVHLNRTVEASTILNSLLRDTASGQSLMANAEVLKLCAENAINQRNWKSAEHYLRKAETLHGKTLTASSHSIRRWRAIKEVLQNRKSGLKSLDRVRSEAKHLKLWESVRECDRAEALALQSQELLAHLYYGTPFFRYKERLKAEANNLTPMPHQYLWNPTRQKSAINILELSFRVRLNKTELDINPHNLNLLSFLTSDFYRSHRLAALHYQLFPGEYFNPLSSPGRVRTAIHRLRQWLKSNKIGIKIEQVNNTYRLKVKGGWAILVGEQRPQPTRALGHEEFIKANWKASEFSASEMANSLKISQRSAQRLIKELLTKQFIARFGTGTNIKYRMR